MLKPSLLRSIQAMGVPLLLKICIRLPSRQEPGKTDCTFAGWYNGDTKWNFNTPITEDVIWGYEVTAAVEGSNGKSRKIMINY